MRYIPPAREVGRGGVGQGSLVSVNVISPDRGSEQSDIYTGEKIIQRRAE